MATDRIAIKGVPADMSEEAFVAELARVKSPVPADAAQGVGALDNVSPSFSPNDSGDGCLRQSKFGGEAAIANAFGITLANCPHGFLRHLRRAATFPACHNLGAQFGMVLVAALHQFGMFTRAMLLPAWQHFWVDLENTPPLLQHVAHIVSMRAKEQMIGANATRIIAVVADKQSFRDRAKRQYPSRAVGEAPGFPAVEMSVPIGLQWPGPYPAGLRLLYARPKLVRIEDWCLAILGGHFAHLLHRLGECQPPDGGCRRGVFLCPNYTIGRG